MGVYLALYKSNMEVGSEEWTLVSPAPTKMEVEWNHTDESSRMLFQFPARDNADARPVEPYQKVALVKMTSKPPLTRPSITEPPLFYGRVNDVRPVEKMADGRRTWELTVRDFMQFLADNHVRPGTWNHNGKAAWDTDWGADGLSWTPDYVRNDSYPGQNRDRIIREVVANILSGTVRAIETGDAERSVWPTSQVLVRNSYMNIGDLRIIDLVATLAGEHPWNYDGGDEYSIGHFFRQSYGQDPNAGADADGLLAASASFVYARKSNYPWEGLASATLFAQGRGDLPTQTTSYGSGGSPLVSMNTTRVIRVLDYDFPTVGHDVFSRVRVYGRGDNMMVDGDVDGDMEGTWDPGQLKYLLTREHIEYDESISDRFDKGGGSQPRLRSRMHQINRSATLRGPTEGWIEVAGLPFSRSAVLAGEASAPPPIPGYVIFLWIRDIGQSNAESFFVERTTWRWPENRTRIQVNRRNFKSMDRVLITQGQVGKAVTTGVKDFWNTGWQDVNPTGNTFAHNLGVVPHRVDVYAKLKTDTTYATVCKAPYGGYDPVQGQYYGFMITKVTDTEVTIQCAEYVAYSAGAGKWVDLGSGQITIVATPL